MSRGGGGGWSVVWSLDLICLKTNLTSVFTCNNAIIILVLLLLSLHVTCNYKKTQKSAKKCKKIIKNRKQLENSIKKSYSNCIFSRLPIVQVWFFHFHFHSWFLVRTVIRSLYRWDIYPISFLYRTISAAVSDVNIIIIFIFFFECLMSE